MDDRIAPFALELFPVQEETQEEAAEPAPQPAPATEPPPETDEPRVAHDGAGMLFKGFALTATKEQDQLNQIKFLVGYALERYGFFSLCWVGTAELCQPVREALANDIPVVHRRQVGHSGIWFGYQGNPNTKT